MLLLTGAARTVEAFLEMLDIPLGFDRTMSCSSLFFRFDSLQSRIGGACTN
jgi:hypothetical protein